MIKVKGPKKPVVNGADRRAPAHRANDKRGNATLTQAGDDILRLARVSRHFGAFRAVDDISIDIRRGEIFSLLGPSGCGKSTTLRLVAGLAQPDGGEIALNGRVLFSASTGAFVPAQKRNMGMVFQSYAIWPHLSVFDTVAYPLAVRKVAKAEIATKVDEDTINAFYIIKMRRE